MVRFVPHQSRKVECRGQSGLDMREQELEPFVRVARAAEAGELALRPELSAIPRRMNAPCERVAAGDSEILRRRGGDVESRVDWLDFPGRVGEADLALLALFVELAPGCNLGA